MRIYNLRNLPLTEYEVCGGKARGLAELMKAGLNVPEGFVIIDLQTSEDYQEAAKYYVQSNLGNVAVRSSANAEDGIDFSSAGQYNSYLNVSNREDFIKALAGCIESLDNETATTYGKFFLQAQSSSMNIVVQQMVDAQFAGVCFTTNPTTKNNEILIEAVNGLGESLVSGLVTAEQYVVEKYHDGSLKIADHTKTIILSNDSIMKIANEALIAVNHFNYELDLEWAIAPGNQLIWLQARPITTMDEATIDELDGLLGDESTVFTTCNIGEMLPGAVTPLSLSTSVMSIDMGLRRMLVKAGAYKNMDEIPAGGCVTSFSNHLFFNLTSIYKMAVSILGADKGSVEASICGKQLDTPPLPWEKKGKLQRTINGIKYFKFVLSRKKAIRKIDNLVAKFNIKDGSNLEEYYQNIDQMMEKFVKTTWYHYMTSSHSGAMSSALMQILASDYQSDEEVKGVIAALLEDIDDIESVDILRSMRRLAKSILNANPDALNYSVEMLYKFITSSDGYVKIAYDSFMKRHGHRGIREAEMRSKSWKQDWYGFTENILMIMKTGANDNEKPESTYENTINNILATKKGILKIVVKYMINQSRFGVKNREYTKSRFVQVADYFKQAYGKLAVMLVEQGALPDSDLIYFLTHEEVGQLIKKRQAKLIKKAIQRRRLFEEQKQVKYNDVYIGKPKAIKIEDINVENGMILNGTPISRGEVKGIARVVKSVEDAKKLQDGEIMVASFTDIGWSPYYSIVGGLVTEVGSALSHGAVVAREYALPLVVNVTNATSIIKTGDYISINGTRGIVTIIEASDMQ